MNSIDKLNVDEIKEIASLIRKKYNDIRISTQDEHLIIEAELDPVETMDNYSNIMSKIKYIQDEYLDGFNSLFNIWFIKNVPCIVVYYERNKID